MKRISTALASALFLCLVVPMCAQQEEPKEPGTAPTQEKRKDQEPQAKPEKQETQEKQKEEPPTESKEQPKANKEEHGQSAQKGQAKVSGKGGHIPDAKFKEDFGRQHTFAVNRVITTTRIVPQQTQFVYSGFTFVFLDPWPAYWAFTDDCYIEYVDDQYFLFDELHPGIQVALLVVE